MRKLKLQMQISIDGFVASPNGEMDWLVWNWDEALIKYVSDITEPVDCIVLGRVLAQGFIPHWASEAVNPDTSNAFALKMYETAKVVFTKTLESSDWTNTDLAKDDLVEEISRLKNQPGKDIIAYGGGNFVSNLIEHGLIDEFHFFINPVMLGGGMPIFQNLKDRQRLKLIHAKSFDCGIAVLCYGRDDTA